MPFYRICPHCHAHLDFCERCDCQDKENGQKLQDKKEAVPDAANIQGGRVENGLPTNISTSILTKE